MVAVSALDWGTRCDANMVWRACCRRTVYETAEGRHVISSNMCTLFSCLLEMVDAVHELSNEVLQRSCRELICLS